MGIEFDGKWISIYAKQKYNLLIYASNKCIDNSISNEYDQLLADWPINSHHAEFLRQQTIRITRTLPWLVSIRSGFNHPSNGNRKWIDRKERKDREWSGVIAFGMRDVAVKRRKTILRIKNKKEISRVSYRADISCVKEKKKIRISLES